MAVKTERERERERKKNSGRIVYMHVCLGLCRQVSVIRGRVVTSDGSSLVGVRVSVVTQPLYGFTLTREQGL